MAIPTPVPSSIKAAWQWAGSAIERGLSGAEALRQYRAGGGEIRTTWWYEGLRAIQGAIESGDRAANIPAPLPVPNIAHEVSPYETRQQFFVTAKVSGEDIQSGVSSTLWVTVESDETMTNDDWNTAIRRAATYGAYNLQPDSIEIGERQLFQRAPQ